MKLPALVCSLVLICPLSSPAQQTAKPRTSVATLQAGQRMDEGPTIWVQAGVVRLVQSTSGSARLRGTSLVGRDSSTSKLVYNWTSDGEYTVEVSGKYQHKVLGAVVGNSMLSKVTSRLTYQELPDSARHRAR